MPRIHMQEHAALAILQRRAGLYSRLPWQTKDHQSKKDEN